MTRMAYGLAGSWNDIVEGSFEWGLQYRGSRWSEERAVYSFGRLGRLGIAET